MHIPKAICGDCGKEMQVDKTGILVEMSAEWGSYYKIYGDRYACINCATSIVLPGDSAAVLHFENRYKLYHADLQGTFIH